MLVILPVFEAFGAELDPVSVEDPSTSEDVITVLAGSVATRMLWAVPVPVASVAPVNVFVEIYEICPLIVVAEPTESAKGGDVASVAPSRL